MPSESENKILIERKGGVATLHSWLNLSRSMEKLQADRRELLISGKPWKQKDPGDQAKDKKCINISQKLLNGDIRVNRYLDVVAKIMGEYR